MIARRRFDFFTLGLLFDNWPWTHESRRQGGLSWEVEILSPAIQLFYVSHLRSRKRHSGTRQSGRLRAERRNDSRSRVACFSTSLNSTNFSLLIYSWNGHMFKIGTKLQQLCLQLHGWLETLSSGFVIIYLPNLTQFLPEHTWNDLKYCWLHV